VLWLAKKKKLEVKPKGAAVNQCQQQKQLSICSSFSTTGLILLSPAVGQFTVIGLPGNICPYLSTGT
jgi:hypothetical protein